MERVRGIPGLGPARTPAGGPGRSLGAERSPSLPGLFLLLLAAVGMAAVLFWAAYHGNVGFAFALLLAGGLFLFVLPRPDLIVVIIISTMLLTYPEILKGRGLLTINNILGAILFVSLLAKVYASRDMWFLREKEIILLVLLGLLFLASTAAAEYTLPDLRFPVHREEGGIVVRDFTRSWLEQFFTRGLVFLIFFVNFITTRRHVQYVLWVVLACILIAVPPSLQAFWSGAGEDFRVTAAKSAFFLGAVDWIKNENRFAFMCLLGISILFYLALITRRRSVKFLVVPAVMSLTGLVLMSGSRSGFLGLVLLGAWTFTRGRVVRRGLRAGILLFGVSAVITFFLLLPPGVQVRLMNINPFNPQGEGTHSTEVRKSTLVQSLVLFAEHPVFGVGLGNFRWVNKYRHDNYKPPHNSYVWALAEGGVFCLVLYLVLFTSLFKRLRLVREKFREDPVIPHIGDWLSLYFLLFLFFSFFADVWLVEVHLYLITGLGIVLQRMASTGRTAPVAA